jgi:hypothetical protein
MFDLGAFKAPTDRDHVEPALVAARALEMQVGLRHPPQFLLFTKSDRKLGTPEVVIHTCLHFHEDERFPVHANQIDLADLDTPISGDGSVSPRTQPLLGEVFTGALDQLPCVWFIHDSVEGNLWV